MNGSKTGVRVNLSGVDGNAFSILGRCSVAWKKANPEDYGERFTEFRREATGGDYDHLLATVMKWFEVDP